MARPSKFDRKEAVELAMNEIWRDGYEANSVKALSEKLGITRSSFYNAFSSCEDLFLEALELYADQSPDQGLADATAGKSVRQILTDMFRAVCKARASDPESRGCLAAKSVAELCGTHEKLGGLLEHLVLGRVASIETLLQRGVGQNEIDSDVDTHTLAFALQNLLIGLNVMSQVVREEQELWKTAEVTLKGLGLFEEGEAHENI